SFARLRLHQPSRSPPMRSLALASVVFISSALAHASGVRVARGYEGRILVRGTSSHEAAGITFDAHDRLYNVSLLGHSLRIIDKNNGKIVWELGFADGVYTPDDLVVAPDGTIYYSSFFTGALGRITPSGEVSAF